MADKFGGCEVIEMAIEIEKNGRDFYAALAQKSSDVIVADLFNFLSKEEEKHIGVFVTLRDAVASCSLNEHTSDEYFAYLNAIAGEHVFMRAGKGAEAAYRVSGDQEALSLALAFEMDSIVFFEGLRDLVPQSESSLIDVLIAQERKHVVQLNEMKKKGAA